MAESPSRAELARLLHRVQAARSRLETFSHSELMVHIPREACHTCGFERAFFGRLQDGAVVGGGVWDEDDPATATDFVRVARALAPRLEEMPLESEVVERNRPALVAVTSGDPRVYRPLVSIARSGAFVVAPVAYPDKPAGLLYADRREEPVDELDRDLLWTFASAVAPLLHRAMLSRAAGGGVVESVAFMPVEPLTQRETEVLKLMAEGASNAAIGETLFISETTVKSHVRQVLRKLRASNRTEAASRYGRLAA